jgi:hypothetical protein
MARNINTSIELLDRDTVLEFFSQYSAFECALKREGFLKAGWNNTAEADWNKFSLYARGRLSSVTEEGFHEAVNAIKKYSPQRQVVRDGRLAWDSVEIRRGESEEQFVLRLVKTVRNNIFHGGKYSDGPISEVARNRAILKAALLILKGCIEIHPGMKQWIQASISI